MRVPCESCGGCGDRELSNHEADTLAAISDGWRLTAEIAPLITVPPDIKLPALANRLVKLEKMGLAQRRAVDGSHFEWRATQQAKARARKAG